MQQIKVLTLCTLLTSAFVAAPAAAAGPDEFGAQGVAALFGERLFGIHFSRVRQELPNGNSVNVSDTSIQLGWTGGRGLYSPFEIPRVGFDYFIIDSLSLGGSLGYASSNVESGNNDQDNEAFIFAPRVGYAIMFTPVIGFWPRGGFTYHSTDDDPGGDDSGMAFTAEAMFILAPVPHFGILFGPTLDIDFTGDDQDDRDRRYRTIALVNVGIGGWF